MAKRKSKSSGLNVFTIVLSIVFGLVLLAMLFKAATSTSTESRSKAVETEIVVNNWEFNGTTKEGWVQTNLSTGSVKNGTFNTGVMSDTRQAMLQQNTVDGDFQNIMLQKLKFSLKVNDPPSKRPSPTPSGRPFTGEVRYMTAGKTTWEFPQTFNGVIDNQLKTYEVPLATLPGVDITKLQITFPLLARSTQLTFDWIRLTGQPKPTPTPTTVFGQAVKIVNNGTASTIMAPAVVPSNSKFTIEAWVKIYPYVTDNSPRRYLFNQTSTNGNTEVKMYLNQGTNSQTRNNGYLGFDVILDSWNINRQGAATFTTNAWHHIALAKGDMYVQLYIDGALSASSGFNRSNLTFNDVKGSSIGAYSKDFLNIVNQLEGEIDEFRVSSTDRYQGASYNIPTQPFKTDANTLALYHFDGDTKDSSGNHNDGRIYGDIDFVDNQIFNRNPRIFVTSTLYSGNLGGYPGADRKCQESADNVGLGGKWKAWLSDGIEPSAGKRLTHRNSPYELLNKTVVANNWTDLIDGTLQNPINFTELKTTVPEVVNDWDVWTNTYPNGNVATDMQVVNCRSFHTDEYSPTLTGMGGSSARKDYYWTSGSGHTCNTKARLYCFEQ